MAATALQDLLRAHQVYCPRLPLALPPPAWGLGELAGRLVQLSAPADGPSALLSVTTALVLEAQRADEPVAWISTDEGSVYPPDLETSGVDLAALALIRVPPGLPPLLRAADRLLRSGAFGLLVLELGRTRELPLAAQTRLAGLAQQHDSALLCLTYRREGAEAGSSLGSLVSLHASASRCASGAGRFSCEVRVLKDKRRGPGWQQREEGYRGPPGLR